MRRSLDVLFSGSRLSSSARSSDMVVDGGSARERVGGRPVPAKLVTRTLILLGAILDMGGCTLRCDAMATAKDDSE